MAKHKGSEGLIKVGTDTIAEVLSFELDESAAEIDTTKLGDADRTYVSGTKSATGSLEAHYDPADTDGQVALAVGATVTLNLFPQGDTSGDEQLACSAIITSSRVSNSDNDETVKRAIGFRVTGAVTRSAVA